MVQRFKIVERGGIFDCAETDERGELLDKIWQQLLPRAVQGQHPSPDGQLGAIGLPVAPSDAASPSGAASSSSTASPLLFAKLRAKAEAVLSSLHALRDAQETFERNEQSLTEQLSRAQGRYSELPDALPGQFMALDKIRQSILDEKQSLLREMRADASEHQRDLNRLKQQLSEAWAEYTSTARTVAAATGSPLQLPSLSDLTDFLSRTCKGEEVVILHGPQETDSVLPRRVP